MKARKKLQHNVLVTEVNLDKSLHNVFLFFACELGLDMNFCFVFACELGLDMNLWFGQGYLRLLTNFHLDRQIS